VDFSLLFLTPWTLPTTNTTKSTDAGLHFFLDLLTNKQGEQGADMLDACHTKVGDTISSMDFNNLVVP
jgi:hypothetical protein